MNPTPSAVAPAPSDLPRRSWHYLARPASFEMASCPCGNHDTQWSEFAKHLWCAKCEQDFLPAHNGVFDGPIPTRLALMMGMSFDRFNMETGCIERFDAETSQYRAEPRTAPPTEPAAPPA